GFPVWLRDVPGIVFRTDNAPFKVQNRSRCSGLLKDSGFDARGNAIFLARRSNNHATVAIGARTKGHGERPCVLSSPPPSIVEGGSEGRLDPSRLWLHRGSRTLSFSVTHESSHLHLSVTLTGGLDSVATLEFSQIQVCPIGFREQSPCLAPVLASTALSHGDALLVPLH
ncbi:hypothetical protein Tsubulata_046783, partial [Turnera subulata]